MLLNQCLAISLSPDDANDQAGDNCSSIDWLDIGDDQTAITTAASVSSKHEASQDPQVTYRELYRQLLDQNRDQLGALGGGRRRSSGASSDSNAPTSSSNSTAGSTCGRDDNYCATSDEPAPQLGTQFIGFIKPSWLLVSGSLDQLERIKQCSLSGNLRPPNGYKIDTIGYLRSVYIDYFGLSASAATQGGSLTLAPVDALEAKTAPDQVAMLTESQQLQRRQHHIHQHHHQQRQHQQVAAKSSSPRSHQDTNEAEHQDTDTETLKSHIERHLQACNRHISELLELLAREQHQYRLLSPKRLEFAINQLAREKRIVLRPMTPSEQTRAKRHSQQVFEQSGLNKYSLGLSRQLAASGGRVSVADSTFTAKSKSTTLDSGCQSWDLVSSSATTGDESLGSPTTCRSPLGGRPAATMAGDRYRAYSFVASSKVVSATSSDNNNNNNNSSKDQTTGDTDAKLVARAGWRDRPSQQQQQRSAISNLFRSKSLRIISSGKLDRVRDLVQPRQAVSQANNNNNCDHDGEATYDYLATAQPRKRSFSMRRSSLAGARRDCGHPSDEGTCCASSEPGNSSRLMVFLRRLFRVRQRNRGLPPAASQHQATTATTTTTTTETEKATTTRLQTTCFVVPIGDHRQLGANSNNHNSRASFRQLQQVLPATATGAGHSNSSFQAARGDQQAPFARRKQDDDDDDGRDRISVTSGSSLDDARLLFNLARPRQCGLRRNSSLRPQAAKRSNSSLSEASCSTTKSSASQQLRRHLDEAYKRHRNCTSQREKDFIDSINVLRQASRHALQHQARPSSSSKSRGQAATSCSSSSTSSGNNDNNATGTGKLACQCQCDKMKAPDTAHYGPANGNEASQQVAQKAARPCKCQDASNNNNDYADDNNAQCQPSGGAPDLSVLMMQQQPQQHLAALEPQNGQLASVTQQQCGDADTLRLQQSQPTDFAAGCCCYCATQPAGHLACPLAGPPGCCLAAGHGSEPGAELCCPMWHSMLYNYYQTYLLGSPSLVLPLGAPFGGGPPPTANPAGAFGGGLLAASQQQQQPAAGQQQQHFANQHPFGLQQLDRSASFSTSTSSLKSHQHQQQHKHNTTIDLKIEIGADFKPKLTAGGDQRTSCVATRRVRRKQKLSEQQSAAASRSPDPATTTTATTRLGGNDSLDDDDDDDNDCRYSTSPDGLQATPTSDSLTDDSLNQQAQQVQQLNPRQQAKLASSASSAYEYDNRDYDDGDHDDDE